MKKALVIATVALLATLPAQARIGDSPQQSDALYCKGEKLSYTGELRGGESWKYVTKDYCLIIIYVNGKSVWEYVYLLDGPMNQTWMKKFIQVNQASDGTWHYYTKEGIWKRGGRLKLIAYREGIMFNIKDVEAVKAAEQ